VPQIFPENTYVIAENTPGFFTLKGKMKNNMALNLFHGLPGL